MLSLRGVIANCAIRDKKIFFLRWNYANGGAPKGVSFGISLNVKRKVTAVPSHSASLNSPLAEQWDKSLSCDQPSIVPSMLRCRAPLQTYRPSNPMWSLWCGLVCEETKSVLNFLLSQKHRRSHYHSIFEAKRDTHKSRIYASAQSSAQHQFP